MNEILAHIYGTGGFELEKTAAEAQELPDNLEELATAIVVQGLEDESDDFEKMASVHNEVYDKILDFDRAGRAIAHREFAGLEKMAFEQGDAGPLTEFLADAQPTQEISPRKAAILAELQRRING